MGEVWPPPSAQIVVDGAAAWAFAIEGLALLGTEGGRRAVGTVLLDAHGSARDAWLASLAAAGPRIVTVPAACGADALRGAVDIEASLAAGRPIHAEGLIARAEGGAMLVRDVHSLDAAALQALREASESERGFLLVVEAATERRAEIERALGGPVGMSVELGHVRWFDIGGEPFSEPHPLPNPACHAAPDPERYASVPDPIIEALDAVAVRTGRSLASTLRLAAMTRAIAAQRGHDDAEPGDALLALRLHLGVPAIASDDQPKNDTDPDIDGLPAETEPPSASDDMGGPPTDPSRPSQEERDDARTSGLAEGQIVPESVLDSILTALPEGILNAGQLPSARPSPGSSGKLGKGTAARGRAIGVASRPPHFGARIDVPATLRAAIPWQRLRPPVEGRAVRVRASDLRYLRRRAPTGTTIVFAVDASGSSAHERLAEAKGAVEHLLARAYARRDEVALIAFRGGQARTLLAPTRGLVTARRAIGMMAGGGGTPLAAGLVATARACEAISRGGRAVTAVVLTDGRGNVALDGRTGRTVATDDERRAALALRRTGAEAIVIDTAARPGRHAPQLAANLGARLVTLPRARGEDIARMVDASLGDAA